MHTVPRSANEIEGDAGGRALAEEDREHVARGELVSVVPRQLIGLAVGDEQLPSRVEPEDDHLRRVQGVAEEPPALVQHQRL